MEENCSIIDAPYVYDQNLLFEENKNLLFEQDKSGFTENIFSFLIFYFKNIIIFFGVIFSSFTGAAIIISNLLLKNVKKDYKKIFEFDSEDEDLFCSEFLDEYKELEERKLEEDDYKKLENKVVYLDTPDSFVVMGYDRDKEAFYYYSNFKDVAYYYLDVVARKFVVCYDCKSLLVNTREEFLKAVENCKKLKEEKEKGEEDEFEKSVFANLKTNSEINKKVTIDPILKVKDKEIPEPDKFNKYIYKGKLDDFKDCEQEEIKNEDFEDINYYYFKSTTID